MEHIQHLHPGKELPILSYGLPYDVAIARHMRTTLHARRPYLLVSGTLSRQTDVVDKIAARISDPTVGGQPDATLAGVRRGMRSHTLYGDLLEVVADLRTTKADSIVVVGGGSLVDAAKAAAFAVANEATTHEQLDALFSATAVHGNGPREKEKEKEKNKTKDSPTILPTAIHPSTIPYLCVPTTLSAGEHSAFGGATNERTHHKQVFIDPNPAAGHRAVLLDPALSTTTPIDVWLSTGMRAVDHCVETACSGQPIAAATEAALAGLRKLLSALLRSRVDPTDQEARLLAQRGTADSMQGIVLYGVSLGASHGIGHQLGPQGVPHAETTCVLLPAVLRYNRKNTTNSQQAEQQQVVLQTLWDEPVVADVLRGAPFHLQPETADLTDAIDAVIRALGLPRTLSHYGIGRDRLDSIAVNSLTDWACQTNPVPLTRKEQVVEILEACL